MIEVFTTNIIIKEQAEAVAKLIEDDFRELKLEFDLEDSGPDYPCQHSILRTEGTLIPSTEIILFIEKLGFRCDILEDKVCSK